MEPATCRVAAPDLQQHVGGDPAAAGRFPPEAIVAAVTPAMGLFSVTDEQLAALVQQASAAVGRDARPPGGRLSA
jgi:hypothetical protein